MIFIFLPHTISFFDFFSFFNSFLISFLPSHSHSPTYTRMYVRTDRLTALVNTFQETAMQRNNNLEVSKRIASSFTPYSSHFLSSPPFSCLPFTAIPHFSHPLPSLFSPFFHSPFLLSSPLLSPLLSSLLFDYFFFPLNATLSLFVVVTYSFPLPLFPLSSPKGRAIAVLFVLLLLSLFSAHFFSSLFPTPRITCSHYL